jgi:hypothetical protein
MWQEWEASDHASLNITDILAEPRGGRIMGSRTLWAALVAVCVVAGFSYSAPAPQASTDVIQAAEQDAKALHELLVKVQAILPKGWQAEATPTMPRDVLGWRHGESPTLAVWRTEKAEGEFVGPNPPGDEHNYTPQTIRFLFVATEYVSSEEWSLRHRENAARIETRIAAMKKLKGIQRFWMGPDPIAPWGYMPETDEEKALLMEYSCVWLRTEPRELPTHFCGNLSFTTDLQETLSFKDTNVNEERARVRQSLEQILREYTEGPQ